MDSKGVTDPDTCEAIRIIHAHGFCPLIMDNMLVLKHWPPRPAPTALIAAMRSRAQDIAEFLLRFNN